METESEITCEGRTTGDAHVPEVECHVRSMNGMARLQDEEATAPLGVCGGGWEEEVTQPGLEVRCRI